MPLKDAVEEAISDLRAGFPGAEVHVVEDGQGGAHVTLDPVALSGGVFVQEETWIGFHLCHLLPNADVYPIHVRPDLMRHDGTELKGNAVNPGNNFQGRPSMMLSRRSNRRDAEVDTPTLKVLRVLDWLTNRWPQA